RMMGAEEQQQTIVDQVVPVQQDTSIGTRFQRIWDQPRGKIMLGSGALAAIMLLGFLLIQLPGNITILAPNTNQENTPVASPEAQTATNATTEATPTTIQSSASEILFNEDFATTKMIGKYNVDVVGPWKIENGKYLIDLSGPNLPWAATFIYPPSREIKEWTDYTVEADLMCEENSSEFFAGVGLRHGGENGISIELHWVANYVALAQDDGKGTQISTSKEFEPAFQKWYHLKLTASGNHIWAYIDDRLVIDYVDPRETQQYYGGIDLGVYGGGRIRCVFDNVKVEADPTVVITTPSLPVPEGELVFDEDFGDGIANGIFIGGEGGSWRVIRDDSANPVFEVKNPSSSWAAVGLAEPSTISDGTIEFRVKLINYDLLADTGSGTVALNFRVASTQGYVYALMPFGQRIQLSYFGKDSGWILMEGGLATYTFEKNIWYSVRLDAQGNNLTAYVNGVRIATVEDSRLTRGGLTFGVGPKTTAYFDDIRVFSIDNGANASPTPVTPTPESEIGQLVFDENFDDGIANEITPNNTKWKIVDDSQGGKLFQVDGKPGSGEDWYGFSLASTTIADGTIEYKIRVLDYELSSGGSVLCGFRGFPGGSYLFELAVGTKSVFMHHQHKAGANYTWSLLDNATAPYILDKNVWYEVRIDIKGNEFTVYIDDKKALTATDDRIKSGNIGFGTLPNTVAQFDDIRVWAQP
ncbi:MAG TPA: family 16 glycoside hydrolase, partial [Anaerolineales bacterium]|nr:family 16 glycoside hydrolase [Anaerolineales bacterium]